MIPMFQVETSAGDFLLTAPIETIKVIFALDPAQILRIQQACANPRTKYRVTFPSAAFERWEEITLQRLPLAIDEGWAGEEDNMLLKKQAG